MPQDPWKVDGGDAREILSRDACQGDCAGGDSIRRYSCEGSPPTSMMGGCHSVAARGAAWARGMAAAISLRILLLPFAAGAADVRVVTTADGLPSNWVTALAPEPGGKLWVGTGNAGVYLFEPATGKGKGYRVADGLSSDETTSIALFRGKVYVGTAAGLSVFDGSKWESITRIENVTLRNVRLAASPGGKELWACSVYLAGGTVRFDGTNWKFMGGKGRGLFNDIESFAFPPTGVVMAGGSGIPYLYAGDEVKVIGEGLPPMSLFAVAEKEEALLLGSSRGMYRFDGNKWKEMPLPPALAGSSVFSIAVQGGRVIAGSDRGIVLVVDGSARFLSRNEGLPADRVTAVAILDGRVAAGTARGLALISNW